MTEQAKEALDKEAKKLAWSQGQIILDKKTFNQDVSKIPIERMVVVPIPDKVEMAALFGANWYHKNVWHDCTKVPRYNYNGVTDLIVSSAYGHIQGVAHTYTPDQWSAHLGFNANRDFKWAYEKDIIDMMEEQK